MAFDDNAWLNKFGNKGVGSFAAYMTTFNMADQTFTFTNAADPATTGTVACTINGVYIPSLPASGVLDWSAAEVGGDALGTYVTSGYTQFFAVFANAAGKLFVNKAGVAAVNGSEVLKIPWYDPTLYVCIGLFKIVSTGWTAGSTAVGTMETEYQVIGPALPHPDNFRM